MKNKHKMSRHFKFLTIKKQLAIYIVLKQVVFKQIMNNLPCRSTE